jgi:hypothetical protein
VSSEGLRCPQRDFEAHWRTPMLAGTRVSCCGDVAAENGATRRAAKQRAEGAASRPIWNQTSKGSVTIAVSTVTKQSAVSQCARRVAAGT